MILAIDIGNSRIHFGCFNGAGRMVASETLSHDDLKRLISRNGTKIKCFPKPKSAVQTAVFSSTCPSMNNLIKRFVKRLFGLKALQAGKDFKIPIANLTDEPEKVGQDRLLSALAAYQLTHKTRKPSIVIDLGTAITLNVVSKNGAFLGGVIAPGMNTMAKALHQNCALLPRIKPHRPATPIGKNTESAMASGIYFGTIGLVQEVVKEIISSLKVKPNIIITGGDAQMFRPHLRFPYQYVPNLTLRGLYIWAKHLQQIPHRWSGLLINN